MSAFASVVLADRNPTNRTFDFIGLSNGVATYAYQPAGSSLDARVTASFSISPASKTSAVHRVKAKMVTPLMDTVDTTKKVGETVVNVEFLLPKLGIKTIRQDSLAFMLDFLNKAPLKDAITDLIVVI